MSESQAKKYRQIMRKQIKAGKGNILDQFVKDLKSLSFRKRLQVSWKILRGSK